MTTRATIDVAQLPSVYMDHRSPIWWGNLLLLFIETTMFGLLIASYYYLRINFTEWPPTRVDATPILYKPFPALGVSTVNLVLIIVSCIPMAFVDRACIQRNAAVVRIALLIVILMGAAAIVLRFFEFGDLKFGWDDNAYGAITWTILGVHLLHLFTGTLESSVMETWLFAKGMDDKHARDIRVTAIYWYWIAGMWVILYLIVYWSPRWL